MAPLILHNVPDEERYVGEDGVQRPYAVVFPGPEGFANQPRSRKAMAETGSFGRSTRRSRSKGAVTPVRERDPSIQAADAVFSKYFAEKASSRAQSPSRKGSLPPSSSQPNLSQANSALALVDNGASSTRYVHKEPTEVILRGFKPSHQYAAIRHYEGLAGRICEDYPRDAPIDQRRFKADLSDSASFRPRLTPEEKAKARRFAGGENWIKVTFESAEAAESAIYSSPQTVFGHIIYAEPYQGAPPTILDAIPASGQGKGVSQSLGAASGQSNRPERRSFSTLSKSFTAPEMSQLGRGHEFSPSGSLNSSTTLESATVSVDSAGTASTATVTGAQSPYDKNSQTVNSQFCSRIPTAKRAILLPASQAVLPQQSLTQRFITNIPLVSWFSKDVIGTEVPRTEMGDFDWNTASFYWRVCWWFDWHFKIFGGELSGNAEKDD